MDVTWNDGYNEPYIGSVDVNPASGSGDSKVSVTGEDHDGLDRQASLDVETNVGGLKETIIVKQSGTRVPFCTGDGIPFYTGDGHTYNVRKPKEVKGIYVLRNCGTDGDIYVNDVLVYSHSVPGWKDAYIPDISLKPGDVIEIRNADYNGLIGTELDVNYVYSVVYDYDPVLDVYKELKSLPDFSTIGFNPVYKFNFKDIPNGHYYVVRIFMYDGSILNVVPGYYSSITYTPVNINELKHINKYVFTGYEKIIEYNNIYSHFITFITESNVDDYTINHGESKINCEMSIYPSVYTIPNNVFYNGYGLEIRGETFLAIRILKYPDITLPCYSFV